jgi:hypothetical protein
MYSVNDTLAGGLPHSDIHGSTPARGSPWLFAACHVLHRLLVPRHPPNALLALEVNLIVRSGHEPAMHRSHPHPPRITPKQPSTPPCAHRVASRNTYTLWPPPPSQRPRTTNVSERRHHGSRAATAPSRRQHVPVSIATAWQRPETHQNLIHPDKEHSTAHRTAPHNNTTRIAPVGGADHTRAVIRNFSATTRQARREASPLKPHQRQRPWKPLLWRRPGSNR